MTGKVAISTLPLHAPQFLEENRIDVRLGTAAISIDRHKQAVEIEGGQAIRFDKLALATGARPRQLACPGAECDDVRYLRSLDDALALRAAAAEASSIVIVGAGYIGLELAASLADGSREITILELAERPLSRVAAPRLADFLASRHRQAGVRIMLRTGLEAVIAERGRVRQVRCSGGAVLPADLVVVGAGILPNTELAEMAGLGCANGIIVDAQARTTQPDVVAAGDCAIFASRWSDRPIRLESVQNATSQGEVAAATVVGKAAVHDSVPWFWSDQYGIKVQTAGLCLDHDETILRGEEGSQKFSIFYLRRGRLIAVDSINSPSDHMTARKLLASGASPTPTQIGDRSFDLKSALATSPA